MVIHVELRLQRWAKSVGVLLLRICCDGAFWRVSVLLGVSNWYWVICGVNLWCLLCGERRRVSETKSALVRNLATLVPQLSEGGDKTTQPREAILGLLRAALQLDTRCRT